MSQSLAKILILVVFRTKSRQPVIIPLEGKRNFVDEAYVWD